MNGERGGTRAALLAAAQSKLSELAEAERDVLRKKYELACIYRQIVDGPRTSEGTLLEACAIALSVDPTTISRWACLARSTDPAQVERLITAPTVDGGVIGASRLRDIGMARGNRRSELLRCTFGSLPQPGDDGSPIAFLPGRQERPDPIDQS
jgi:hypothetical protein